VNVKCESLNYHKFKNLGNTWSVVLQVSKIDITDVYMYRPCFTVLELPEANVNKRIFCEINTLAISLEFSF
jgi:hypothetical protein